MVTTFSPSPSPSSSSSPLPLPWSQSSTSIAFEIDAAHLRRQAKRPRHIALRFHHSNSDDIDGPTSSSSDSEHDYCDHLSVAARNRERLLNARKAKLAHHHGHVRNIQGSVAQARQFAQHSTLIAVERTLQLAQLNRQATLESRRSHSARTVQRAKQVAKLAQQQAERRALNAQRLLREKLRASQWRRQQILKLSRTSLNQPSILEQGIRERATVEIQTWWRKLTVGQSFSKFARLLCPPHPVIITPTLSHTKSSRLALIGALNINRLTELPFPEAAAVLQKPNIIRITSNFLHRIKKCTIDSPKLGKTPTRIFLTVFMLMSHHEAIIDDPEGAIEKELLNTAATLMSAIDTLTCNFPITPNTANAFHVGISGFLQAWFAYHNTFEAFKSKDTQSVVDYLIAHGIELARLLNNVTGNGSNDTTDAEWRPSIVKQLKVIRQRLFRVGGENAMKQFTKILEEESLTTVLNSQSRPASPFKSGSDDSNSDSVLVPSPNKRSLLYRSSATSSSSLNSVEPSHPISRDTSLCQPPTNHTESIPEATLKANNSVELNHILGNHALAHEVIMDPEFVIKPPPTPTGIAAQVKEMAERAFAQRLNEMVHNKDYSFVPELVLEIRDSLVDIARQASSSLVGNPNNVLVTQISNSLDPDLIQNEISNTGLIDLSALLETVVHLIYSLAAPIRDSDIAALQELASSGTDEFGDILLQIHKLIDIIRLDLINYHLIQLRPILKSRAVEYETAKFAQLVASAGVQMSLRKTQTWITKAAQDLLQTFQQRNPEGVPLTEATRPKFEDVYHEALLSLISPASTASAVSPDSVPETFAMDVRRLFDMQNMAKAIALTGALVMVVRNAFPWMRTVSVLIEEPVGPTLPGGRAAPCVQRKIPATHQLADQLMVQLVDILSDSDNRSYNSFGHIAALIIQVVAQQFPTSSVTSESNNNNNNNNNNLFDNDDVINRLSQSQRELVTSLVTKTISSRDPVFTIVARRVHTLLRNYLSIASVSAVDIVTATPPSSSTTTSSVSSDSKFLTKSPIRLRRDSLTANGLDVVESHINTLGSRLATLALHNKAVYAQWYDEILGRALAL